MRTLIFDTETTGLVKNSLTPLDKQPSVIEFFGLVLNDNEEVESFTTLINPGFKIEYIITNITGITNDMLSDKPKFRESAETIKNMIEGADEVVAHNLAFDKAMLDFEFMRLDTELKWPAMICTVEATRHLKGHRLNLMALYEMLFSERFTEAHRAENDVRALARCFLKLRENGAV